MLPPPAVTEETDLSVVCGELGMRYYPLMTVEQLERGSETADIEQFGGSIYAGGEHPCTCQIK